MNGLAMSVPAFHFIGVSKPNEATRSTLEKTALSCILLQMVR
jgi:hypothetical protein